MRITHALDEQRTGIILVLVLEAGYEQRPNPNLHASQGALDIMIVVRLTHYDFLLCFFKG